ncbi:MAG: hypothetical protein GX133_08235 [Syntrophomonadaceae bacterium]|nr:hypothetical protein [Syntrophomonadaceae bacterium]
MLPPVTSVKAENLAQGTVKYVSEGYFFMVSLDRNGRPNEVPPLEIENERQQRLFEDAKSRIAKMKPGKMPSDSFGT